VVDAVVAKALAKSADDRYSTAPEFAAAMRKALTGTATRRTQQSDEVRVPETVLTSPAAAPPAAPPPSVPGEPAARRRGPRPLFVALGLALLAAIGGGVAAALLLTGGGSSSSSASSLLEVVVPTEVANACTKQNVPQGKAVETDLCTPPANAATAFPDNLTLDFYSSGTDVAAAYDAQVSASGLTRNTGRCDRSTWKGEGSWHHPDGKFGGHRLCYVDGNGDSVIAWTHEKKGSDNHVDMLGIAKEPGRGNSASLFSWWNPYHQIIGKCRARGSETLCVDTIKKITGQ
jgi:hypothetical protein